MPPNTISVTRPGPFGNPFDLRSADHCWTAIAHGFKGDRLGRQKASVAMFLMWVINGRPADVADCGLFCDNPDGKGAIPISVSPAIGAPAPPSITRIRHDLAGRNLACWCRLGEPCHGDVLLKLANG